jgi:hypothetical protein
LDICYQHAKGRKQDHKKAAEWCVEAYHHLGYYSEKAMGVQENSKKKAFKQGNINASIKLSSTTSLQ